MMGYGGLIQLFVLIKCGSLPALFCYCFRKGDLPLERVMSEVHFQMIEWRG